jgi:hypothetical protein
MDESSFWELIDNSRHGYLRTRTSMSKCLENYLVKLPIDEIISFDTILIDWLEKTYSNELWAAYSVATGWTNIIRFDNFRAWLVAMGRDYTQRVLETPELLLHGLSAIGAERIGKGVRNASSYALYLHPYTGGEPKLANQYSRRSKPIGTPLSSEHYARLREKYAMLINLYDLGDDPEIKFVNVNIRIEEEQLSQLSELAAQKDASIETLVGIAIEHYIWEEKRKGGS